MTKSQFVIIKHEAKRAGLHYDFRFKLPNSNNWDSYAVRKGIPVYPGKKVLAVKTTIHTRKEALFTGVIKTGYGAGKLTKWDSGTCTIIKYTKSHIIINLSGSKTKGTYHLISTGVMDKNYDKPTYLLFKGKTLNENANDAWAGCGMISRVPPGDTEEVEIDDDSADKQQKFHLSWSLTDGKPSHKQLAWALKEVQKIDNYTTTLMIFTPTKGIFKIKPKGEFLVIAVHSLETIIIFQIFEHIKNNLYLCGVIGAYESQDSTLLLDKLKFHPQFKILEDNIPTKINNFKFDFKKPSKYMGKGFQLFKMKEFPPGYLVLKADIKKNFEPAVKYKVKDKLSNAQNMRTLITSKIKSLIKRS